MEIRTVMHYNPVDFDQQVNEALADGFTLERRDLVFSTTGAGHHFAQLTKKDPEPEPVPADPIDLVRAIREVCLATDGDDCGTDRCPLNAWCEQLRAGGDPTDWILPAEVTE